MNFSEIATPFNLTLGILALSALAFMSGRIRADIVALCTMLALMLLGILTPGEALAGFSSSVVIMMVGLFVVGAGIFRTGLAKMISGKILKLGGRNENLLFVLVMLVTAGIGAFVSNTGTVAVMMPIVMSMAAGSGIDARRYLMPMAFASSMGMFTLISTPPNLVIQEELVKHGYEPLKFFSFAPVGLIAVGVGIVVLYFLSRILKSGKRYAAEKENRGKSLAQLVEEYNISVELYKLVVPKGSPLVGLTLADAGVAAMYGVSVVKVVRRRPVRGRILLKGPAEEEAGPKTVVKTGDTLYCRGGEENIDRFASEQSLARETMSSRESSEQLGKYGIAEAYIIPNSKLINNTVSESRFREKYNVNVLGIKHRGEYEIGDVKDIKLHSGDALLLQGSWEEIAGMAQKQGNFVVVGQPAAEAAKVTLDSRAPVAAGIMLLMIIAMVLNVMPAVTAVLCAAILMVATGCLRNMEEAYGSINWSSIILIGSMIPLATAFEKTGVTAFIAQWMLTGLGDTGPGMLLAVIYLATSVLTMFVSNTATAVLFAPIAMQAAVGMGVSPWPFLFAVAVAASMCFASPFSTPPNALVMSAGRYTFKDYIKVGLPLQVVMGVVMVLLLPLIFPFE